MSVLVAYRSRYGTAAEIAGKLVSQLPGENRAVDLREQREPPISSHRVVLIGASVYAGGIQKEVDRFCETFQEELAGRPVGLYLSCLYKGADAERQLADAFPPWLLTHAFGRYLVGGRVRLSELRLLDRVLFTRIAGVKRDVDEVDHQEIERMVADTQAQLSGLGA